MLDKNLLVLESSLKMPLMNLPVKTTLVRLTNSRVLMISPFPGIDRYNDQVRQFGDVTDILAPSLFHNLGLKTALKQYPDAKLWGVSGYKEKLPELPWNRILNSENWNHGEELKLIEIEGMPKVNEVVFLHTPSRTLIVTDLCFNHIHGKGLGYWIVFNLFGTYKRLGVSRLFLKMVRDKERFSQSVKRLLSLDFDNLIIPHGENIVGEAKKKLRFAFQERGY